MQDYKIGELTLSRVTLGELIDALSLLGFEIFQKRRVDYVKGTIKHPLLADGEEIDAKKATEELIAIASEYGRTISAVAELLVNGKDSQELEPAQAIEFESSGSGPALTEDQLYVLQQLLNEQTQFADTVAPILLAHQIEELAKAKPRALKKPEVRNALNQLMQKRSSIGQLGKRREDGVMVMQSLKELCNMTTMEVPSEEVKDLPPTTPTRNLPLLNGNELNGSKPKTPLPVGLLKNDSEPTN